MFATTYYYPKRRGFQEFQTQNTAPGGISRQLQTDWGLSGYSYVRASCPIYTLEGFENWPLLLEEFSHVVLPVLIGGRKGSRP